MEIIGDKKSVVIVTGASRGIGLAITTALLKELDSCVITISRKSNDALVALAADHPETLAVVLGDVTDPSTSKQAVTSAIEQFGHLDGVILNAGVLYPMGTVASIPVDATASDGDSSSGKLSPTDTWKSLFDVNFFSLIYTVQAALPALRASPRKGRIIMVSSGASVKGQYGWGPYAASKAAVNSLVKTLATEEPNVATIAIRPGVVDTDMQTLLRSSTDALRTEDVKPFVDLFASGKLAKPADPGYVIASLSISAKDELSGQYVSWDGEECKQHRRQRQD
ncbi:hypothetical protein FRB91_008431 [Serendipita sp. 411]|nr:hypothetical protein FRC15_008502 [Serendipita sp. 397]KAG8832782.1 hypothetical protein FRC20_007810 [Serendipita sp. 405]KAG8833168.1 hypothetical protein FRC18_004065 [Serendipita sp. 400]KAG8836875.1 hypothetical protein FRB91_008431 [Serendipita sp. 411]